MLILGSQSPRRKEILGYFDLPFEVCNPDFDENSVPFKGDPAAYVNTLAESKARSLAEKFPRQPLLTADTIVYHAGQIYGKPQDEAHAQQMLLELSGKWHSVYTGVAVYYFGHMLSQAEETKVLFNTLTTQQIALYHQKLHLYDKAGSYQLQTAGGLIVKKIEGCYYNVIGLPLNTTCQLLKEVAKIDLWSCLK